MKTSGVFFLRSRPYTTRLRTPHEGDVRGWLLQLGERTESGGVDTITATWRGQAADLFFLQHNALKAGDCLQVELERLHAKENELRGRVVRCSVAPPRWPRADTEEATPIPTSASSPYRARSADRAPT